MAAMAASECTRWFSQNVPIRTTAAQFRAAAFLAKESAVPQSPENHGKDRLPSSSVLRPRLREALLFISAVAVWPAE